MNPVQQLRSKGRRLVVIECTETGAMQVFALQRVGMPAFLRLAVDAMAIAKGDAEHQDELASRLRGAKTDEDRARITAAVAEAAAKRMGDVTPDQLQAMQSRADELIMGSVVAIGIGRDDLAPGLLPPGTAAADVCQELEEGKAEYLRAIAWSTDALPPGDKLSIQCIPDVERMHLANAIALAFGPSREVTSFRDGPRSGAAGDRGPVGDEVRAPAQRAAPVRRRGRGDPGPRSHGDR